MQSAEKRKGPKPLSQHLPLMPVVPMMPAIAAGPMTVVPAVTTPIMRVIVAATVIMAVPAMAPFVADISGRNDA